jgi:phosphoribosylformylglycinamidine synthase
MFDGSVGANTVLWPFGGSNQITPPDAMVAKLPLLEGETDAATFMAWGFDPYLSEQSPFHGAAYAVTESVCKAVAAGARLSDIRLTLQEYFPRLGHDPKRWGLPFAALLGAFRAQHELRLAAIGGKDSMSGSFNELDVPPTLVSFALAPGYASLALSPEFKKTNSTVSLLTTPILPNGLPDFAALKEIAESLHQLNKAGKIISLHHIGAAGIPAAIAKCCFGNRIGFNGSTDAPSVFSTSSPAYFSFLIEHAASDSIPGAIIIGETTSEPTLTINGESHALTDLQTAWQSTLEPIYPTKPDSSKISPIGPLRPISSNQQSTIVNPQPVRRSLGEVGSSIKPRVLIPAFPGTNSEYDSARAFQRVGAETHIEVFRNLSAKHIEESIHALAKQIKTSQILFVPGGFSAGDEPDGSAKFIATILRNPRVSDAISDLLENRDGLILGICNGFQALIKTGLATHGKVIATDTNSATLVHNDISRHISQYVQTRIINNSSPWLANQEIGTIHTVPVSHGEGKFYAPEEVIVKLAANGQIATQYCDPHGNPTMQHPFNPNGSLCAVEGITSPCGRVLGKMAHSERCSAGVAKNIPGNKVQPIFAAGVSYFG